MRFRLCANTVDKIAANRYRKRCQNTKRVDFPKRGRVHRYFNWDCSNRFILMFTDQSNYLRIVLLHIAHGSCARIFHSWIFLRQFVNSHWCYLLEWGCFFLLLIFWIFKRPLKFYNRLIIKKERQFIWIITLFRLSSCILFYWEWNLPRGERLFGNMNDTS